MMSLINFNNSTGALEFRLWKMKTNTNEEIDIHCACARGDLSEMAECKTCKENQRSKH